MTGELVERLSAPRNVGDWSYVVRRGGVAVELCVRRADSGELEFADGSLHRRAAAFQQVRTQDCELVGGPCDFDGAVGVLLPLFEREAVKEARDWLQPESFWKALEALL